MIPVTMYFNSQNAEIFHNSLLAILNNVDVVSKTVLEITIEKLISNLVVRWCGDWFLVPCI